MLYVTRYWHIDIGQDECIYLYYNTLRILSWGSISYNVGTLFFLLLSRPALREPFYFSIWLGQGVMWGGHSMFCFLCFFISMFWPGMILNQGQLSIVVFHWESYLGSPFSFLSVCVAWRFRGHDYIHHCVRRSTVPCKSIHPLDIFPILLAYNLELK